MNAAQQVAKFVSNPQINKRDNDTTVKLGRRTSVAQFRFNATETSSLVKAIKGQPEKTQAALVRALHRRSRQLSMGQVNFITPASARVINDLAKQLKISERFEVSSERNIKLKTQIYTSLPSQTWDWYKTNTVLGRLPQLYSEANDRDQLTKLGMHKDGPTRWSAPDGTWVSYGGGRVKLGFQKWHLGQLPYNNRIAGR